VRHLRRDQRMQLKAAKVLVRFATRDATESCGGAAARELGKQTPKPTSSRMSFCIAARSTHQFFLSDCSIEADIVVTRLLRSITHIAEIVVKNLTISYASRKPRVTYGRFAGDFERRVRQRLFESHVNTCEGKCVENAVALPSFAMTCFSK
jgi:hypothetical protein